MNLLQKMYAGAGLLVVSSAAFADLPAAVTSAITGAGTDAGTAISAIIVVGVGIWALNRVRRLFP